MKYILIITLLVTSVCVLAQDRTLQKIESIDKVVFDIANRKELQRGIHSRFFRHVWAEDEDDPTTRYYSYSLSPWESTVSCRFQTDDDANVVYLKLSYEDDLDDQGSVGYSWCVFYRDNRLIYIRIVRSNNPYADENDYRTYDYYQTYFDDEGTPLRSYYKQWTRHPGEPYHEYTRHESDSIPLSDTPDLFLQLCKNAKPLFDCLNSQESKSGDYEMPKELGGHVRRCHGIRFETITDYFLITHFVLWLMFVTCTYNYVARSLRLSQRRKRHYSRNWIRIA